MGENTNEQKNRTLTTSSLSEKQRNALKDEAKNDVRHIAGLIMKPVGVVVAVIAVVITSLMAERFESTTLINWVWPSGFWVVAIFFYVMGDRMVSKSEQAVMDNVWRRKD